MFTESADLYDAIYSFKDYAAESTQIAALVRSVCPDARRILDIGCGTGEHVRRLAADHGFEADGLDLDAGLLEVARRKHPEGRFFVADMTEFALDYRYDAVLCLFSSIGYLVTLERVRRAIGCFRDHLSSGGVVVIEPWFGPGALEVGRIFRQTAETDAWRVERVSHTEIEGRISRLHFEYRVEGQAGSRSFREVHELGLFTQGEMLSAFQAEGLTADFDPVGLTGRGLWVARVAA